MSNPLVNSHAVASSISEYWSPRTVGVINDYDVRFVKVKGEFTRRSHPRTDELFLVLSGALTIRLDGADIRLGPGDITVVPKGTQAVRRDGGDVSVFRAERFGQHRRHAERADAKVMPGESG